MAAHHAHRARRSRTDLWPLALAPLTATPALIWGRGDLAVLGLVTLVSLTALLALRRAAPAPARDPETGFILRAELERRLDDLSIDDAPDRAAAKACLVLDLDGMDRFRQIWGADATEAALRVCVERLDQILRQSDRLARLGPYRFGLAIPYGRRVNLDTCLSLAERCQAALAEPIAVKGATIHLTCSAGLALRSSFPQATGPRLLAAAETALDQARKAGVGSLRVYSPIQPKAELAAPALAETVSRALDDNEVTAVFQPQADMAQGRILGFEALARWTTPELRDIPPGQFLPAVDASGQAFRLTEAMLTESLRALTALTEAGYDTCTMAMNLSLSDLHEPRLPARVARDLDRFAVSPDRLRFEVTEDVLAPADAGQMRQSLVGLADIGCRIDLDGFGCDGGSLTSLRGLPIDRIKIARQIVAGIDRDAENHDLTAAILTLARSLRIETLAMGVETMGEYALLRDMGCDAMQGFALGHPMALDDALTWLDRRQRPRDRKAAPGFLPLSLGVQST